MGKIQEDLSPCPRHPHPHLSHCGYFLDWRAFSPNFLPEWPLNFFVSMIHQGIWFSPSTFLGYFVLLSWYWGIITVPEFLHEQAKGLRTHDLKLLTYLLTLSSLRQPWVAGSSSIILTTLLAIPMPCSSSLNGPSNECHQQPGASPDSSVSGRVESSFSLMGEGPEKW